MGVNDNEVFWEDLLSHIRQQVLVPVVGPDLTVVNVGDAEQTLTTLIGQRLAERYQSDRVRPGQRPRVKRWRRSCESAARMSSSGCIASSTTSSTELDPAPGDALRDLAAIDDLRLFVSTTPDRLLAKAVNEVRFKGSPRTRELSFSPNQSTANSRENAEPAETDRHRHSQSVRSGRLDAPVRDPRGGPAGVATRVAQPTRQVFPSGLHSVEASADAVHRLRDSRLARAVSAAHVQPIPAVSGTQPAVLLRR